MIFLSDKIERYFISLIVDKVTTKDIPLKSFAVQVWPDMSQKSAHEKIRLLTEGYPQKGGAPQRLTFGDAYRMAVVLQIPLGYLVAIAEESMANEGAGLAAR